MTPAARLAAAIELVDAIARGRERPADAWASDYFRDRRYVGGTDRRAIGEMVWQVLRAWRRLDWWLGIADEDPAARLRVAGLLLLDQGMRLAALEALFSGGRFGPAPLGAEERRRLAALEGGRLDHPDQPPDVRLECPSWLFPHLQRRFGEETAAELSALLAPAPLDLRVNTLKTDRAEARARLAAEGLAFDPTPLSPWGLRAASRLPVMGSAPFREGLVEVQDEGSQLVALLLGAKPGERVCDFCAGAGGKSLALAMMMANRGRLVAADVSAVRLAAAERRFRRAGLSNVACHVLTPGDKWRKRQRRSFDRVLVDAPCSGSGTWRRNPDARLTLRAEGLNELLARQRKILEDAAELVRPGGRLVYATCSLLIEENEDQVMALLAARPDEFRVVPLEEAWAEAGLAGPPPTHPRRLGPHLFLTPRRHGTDGFFAAILERRP
jgi:16S rRNA (cytosine967-C5)-methyltransferase